MFHPTYTKIEMLTRAMSPYTVTLAATIVGPSGLWKDVDTAQIPRDKHIAILEKAAKKAYSSFVQGHRGLYRLFSELVDELKAELKEMK